ncbi:glycosyltransferase family 87 protein [Halosegnis marinus]|uniref:glycosyltransferase family 87 protein n=1 Tax=Halosegnis marinus TaxID=3034023 RepID=UPI003618690D
MPSLARLRALWNDRPAFAGLAAAFACFLLVYPAIDWWLRSIDLAPPFVFWDFGAYGGAVERWLANEQIYERNADGGFFGTYLYPPVFLVLFRPFAQLPNGALVWAVSSLLFLWGCLVAVVQTLTRRLSWPERLFGLWLLVGFQPVLLNVKMGQTGAFMAGLLCLAFVAMERGHADRGRGSPAARRPASSASSSSRTRPSAPTSSRTASGSSRRSARGSASWRCRSCCSGSRSTCATSMCWRGASDRAG